MLLYFISPFQCICRELSILCSMYVDVWFAFVRPK